MNLNYRVRIHDKYGKDTFRVELVNEDQILEATMVVPARDLKDFPVGGVISMSTEIVEKAPPPKPKEITKIGQQEATKA